MRHVNLHKMKLSPCISQTIDKSHTLKLQKEDRQRAKVYITQKTIYYTCTHKRFVHVFNFFLKHHQKEGSQTLTEIMYKLIPCMYL